MSQNLPAVWLVPIFFLSGIASAQRPAPASPASEAPQAAVTGYRSAFEGYKPYTDDKLLTWKDANDSTGQIGGWRAYAKEARQPDSKAPAHDMSAMPDSRKGSSKP
jgi:hypothetical protein